MNDESDKTARVVEIAVELADALERMQMLHLRRQTLRTADVVEAGKADAEFYAHSASLLSKEVALVEAVRALRWIGQAREGLQERLTEIKGMIAEALKKEELVPKDMDAAIAYAQKEGAWIEESESDVKGFAVACAYDLAGYYLGVFETKQVAQMWAQTKGIRIKEWAK